MLKLKSLLNEAILWSGNSTQAFKTNEDATFEPVNTNTEHDVQTEAKGMNTKTFVKAVQDEFDVETLKLMQGIIQKQITLVQKMGDMANPRKTVKGFRREGLRESKEYALTTNITQDLQTIEQGYKTPGVKKIVKKLLGLIYDLQQELK